MRDIAEIDLNNPDVYQNKVWGDTDALISTFGENLDVPLDRSIGEIFLASTHPDGVSRFTDGRVLTDEINNEASVFGRTIGPNGVLPLLLKAIFANEPLSVQVHYKNKVEAWYTLTDGEMLYGLTPLGEKTIRTRKGVENLKDLLQNATEIEALEPYFNRVKFKAGETYLIQAGVVHSLLRGSILEPQKNSNLTIRGGDWGRNKPNRPLFLDDFFAALYPQAIEPQPIEPKIKIYRGDEKVAKNSEHACLVATRDFALDRITVRNGWRLIRTFLDRFLVVMVTSGRMEVTNGVVNVPMKKGQVFILGAVDNEWIFKGTGTVLITYVPHLKKGIIVPLKTSGYTYDKIIEIGGPILKENDVYIEMKELGYY